MRPTLFENLVVFLNTWCLTSAQRNQTTGKARHNGLILQTKEWLRGSTVNINKSFIKLAIHQSSTVLYKEMKVNDANDLQSLICKFDLMVNDI